MALRREKCQQNEIPIDSPTNDFFKLLQRKLPERFIFLQDISGTKKLPPKLSCPERGKAPSSASVRQSHPGFTQWDRKATWLKVQTPFLRSWDGRKQLSQLLEPLPIKSLPSNLGVFCLYLDGKHSSWKYKSCFKRYPKILSRFINNFQQQY